MAVFSILVNSPACTRLSCAFFLLDSSLIVSTPSFILIRSKIRHAAVVVHDVSVHVYEVRPRTDHRGVELNSDALPLGRLWYGEPDAISNAIDYAKFYSRSRDAAIRVYDDTGNVLETHAHKGDFKEW